MSKKIIPRDLITKLSFILVVRTSLTLISGVVGPLWVIHYLALSGLGRYASLNAGSWFIQVLGELGFTGLFLRLGAHRRRYQKKIVFYDALWARISSFPLIIIVALMVSMIFAFNNKNHDLKSAFLLITLSSPIFLLQNFVLQSNIGMGNTKIQIGGEIIYKVAYLSILFIGLPHHKSQFFLVTTTVSSALVQLFYFFYYIHRSFKGESLYRFSRARIFHNYREALPYSTLTISYILYGKIDLLLLNLLVSPIYVGIYSLAYRAAEIMMDAANVATSFFFKNIAQSAKNKYKEIRSFVFTSSIILAAIAAFSSPFAAGFIKGGGVRLSHTITILTLTGVFMAVNTLQIGMLQVQKKPKTIAFTFIVGGFLETISIILGGRFNPPVGAAMMVLFLEISLFFVFLKYTAYHISLNFFKPIIEIYLPALIIGLLPIYAELKLILGLFYILIYLFITKNFRELITTITKDED